MDIERAKELFKMRIETEEYSGMTTNTLKEAMTTVLSELEKKEAIINEMAIYLADIDFDECCAEIPEPCLGCSWEDYEPHINCIKQYFTNEVEKEGIKE